jgi:hypothetical protein
MTTTFLELLPRIRLMIGDQPLLIDDQIYSDRQIAAFVPLALDDMNMDTVQQVEATGVGPLATTFSPTLMNYTRRMVTLHIARVLLEYDLQESRRVGFRIQNVAGAVDGRSRFLTNRDGVNEIEQKLKALKQRQSQISGESTGTFRTMARNANPEGAS